MRRGLALLIRGHHGRCLSTPSLIRKLLVCCSLQGWDTEAHNPCRATSTLHIKIMASVILLGATAVAYTLVMSHQKYPQIPKREGARPG
jgi:hypothetical protein